MTAIVIAVVAGAAWCSAAAAMTPDRDSSVAAELRDDQPAVHAARADQTVPRASPAPAPGALAEADMAARLGSGLPVAAQLDEPPAVTAVALRARGPPDG